MQEKLKDILSHLSQKINQETLLQYLQSQLTPEKKHELEKQLVDNPFASDALEGLSQVRDKRQIQFMIELLNRDLKKKTERRKKRRDQLRLPDQSTLYIAIIIFLLLIVISFFIIYRMRG